MQKIVANAVIRTTPGTFGSASTWSPPRRSHGRRLTAQGFFRRAVSDRLIDSHQLEPPPARMADSEPSPTPGTPRTDPYAAWRIANYRRYAASWFAMTIARQIETVAIGVYIYALTNDKAALGILGLVQALPVMLLAIPGGHLADRVDRRLVLAITLGLTAAVSAALSVACCFQSPVHWIYLLIRSSIRWHRPSAVADRIVALDRSRRAIQQCGFLEYDDIPCWLDGRPRAGRPGNGDEPRLGRGIALP